MDGFDLRFARSPVVPVVEEYELFLQGDCSWEQLLETLQACCAYLELRLEHARTAEPATVPSLTRVVDLVSMLAQLVEREEFQAAGDVINGLLEVEDQMTTQVEAPRFEIDENLDEEALHQLLLSEYTEQELTTRNFSRMEECVTKLVRFGEPRPLERMVVEMRQLLVDCRTCYGQLDQPKTWTGHAYLGDRLLAQAFDEWSRALDLLTVGYRERDDEVLGQGLDLFWAANRKLVMVNYLSAMAPDESPPEDGS